MMKRKIYDTLLDWKKQRNGKVAVMIDGARRIGKKVSHVTEFCDFTHFSQKTFCDYNIFLT